MAVGNALVTTAKFKPLTIAEWAAPLKEFSTQHAATEEALWELQDKAAEYEQYLINNPDSPLTQKYNAYIDDIDRLSEQLAVNGISPQIRTDLLNLRRDYSNIVKPIKTGLAAYQEAVAKRNKDYNKGIIGSDITPELYITNPAYIDNYTTMEDIYKNASKVFKGLSGYSTEPYNRTLDDGSSVMVTPQSYSANDFINAFEGKEAPEEIVNAVNSLRQQYSAYAQNDEDSATTIEQSLKLAAQSAIKDPKYSGRHYPPAPKEKKTESEKPYEPIAAELSPTMAYTDTEGKLQLKPSASSWENGTPLTFEEVKANDVLMGYYNTYAAKFTRAQRHPEEYEYRRTSGGLMIRRKTNEVSHVDTSDLSGVN